MYDQLMLKISIISVCPLPSSAKTLSLNGILTFSYFCYVKSGEDSLAQRIASLSLEKASDGYSSEPTSSTPTLTLPTAYSSDASAYGDSQDSSLASMPYQNEISDSQTSSSSFGVRLPQALASLPTSSYAGSNSTSYSAYSNQTAYTESQPTNGSYITQPSSQPSTGYVDGSYPYANDSLEMSASASQGTDSPASFDLKDSYETSLGPAVAPFARSGSNVSSSSNLRGSFASGGGSDRSGATSSPAASLQSSGRNWTRDFYTVQSTISKSGDNLDTVEVMDQLTMMTENFTNDAIAYGSIIIREQKLPVAQKTIKPVGVGGIAGGQKFIHEGIFFKFPTNEQDLYGNLENAMRGAGHEMKGLTGLINWELKTIGLHTIKFPLTAIIDYYGYRLVATAVLPLSSKTMVIGSGDAGASVFDGRENNRVSSQRLANLIQDWGKYLNVAPHDFRCRGFGNKIVKVSVCFDLEGHVGTDGNFYLCDFARTFPPADPNGVAGRFLYRLLRPEFVKKYRVPLSSDSFLASQVDKSLNVTTKEATKYLTTTWLIEAVKVWNRTMNCVPPPRILSLLLHQSGINLRFLRLVAAAVLDSALKRAVNVEIMARTFKSLIRNEIRESGDLSDINVLNIIVKWFNLAFTDSEEANEYWNKELHLEMFKRFDGPDQNFWNVAEEILSGASTPSSSPNPSPSSSLANSANIPYSPNSSQGPVADSLSFDDSPAPSPTAPRSGGRGRGKKASAQTDATPTKARSRKTTPKSTAARTSVSSSAEKKTPTRVTRTKNKTTSAAAATPTEAVSSAPRRSTRARKLQDPGPLPDWIDQLEADDEDYVESSSSSEDDDFSDSGSSDGINLPSRYAVAYGEDIASDDDEVIEKPAKRSATRSRKTKSKTVEPSKTSQDGDTPSTNSIMIPIPSRTPSTPSDGPQKPPLSSTPSRGLLPPGVHLKRDLGISKNDINPEMLFDRLQELLGCYFGNSGKIKFQAVYRHLKRDVKPIRLDDGTEVEPTPVLALQASDVQRYVPRIKQMFLTPFQLAFRYKKEADETEDFDEREEKLRMSWESYLECLERNPLGDFALHNAARVLNAWIPFFLESTSNEVKCLSYLARRFAVLAEQQNKDLVTFKADVYKTSDLRETRTSRVLAKSHVDWCSDSIIRNMVMRKLELSEIASDFLRNSDPSTSEMELRELLKDVYGQMFQEFATQASTKSRAKKVAATPSSVVDVKSMVIERKVAVQYWRMISLLIAPVQQNHFEELLVKLAQLPKEKALLTHDHWVLVSKLIFGDEAH